MRLISSLLIFTWLTAPAIAADIAATSRIDAVTLFPQGAEVTRVVTAALQAGEHTLILKDFPGELDQQSLRVEGTSAGKIEISSVDSRVMYLPSAPQDAARKRIEDEITALQDERNGLDGEIADASARKQLLLSLADKQLQPQSKDHTTVQVDAAELGAIVDLVAGKLSEVTKFIHAAQIRQRAIDRSIYDLQVKLNEVSPQQVALTEVAIHLAAAAATDGTFAIRYRVGNAGWQPFYDARLTSPEKTTPPRVELIRRAEAMQSTAEAWDNVRLTLSTARPLGATAAPDLWPEEIRPGVSAPLAATQEDGAFSKEKKARNAINMAPEEAEALDAAGAPARKPAAVSQTQASVEVAGFQALYGIQGRVSIGNSGVSKKLRIDSGAFDATLVAITVPMRDPTAYLTAAFNVTGETPMLPGTVNLYRDGVFIGQGALPLLNPGEEAKLGFGADDLIKVKRAEVKRTTGAEGLITTSNTDERAYDISVQNLHDVPVKVTVIDRIPFSSDSAIVVEPMSGMTPPAHKDLDKRRGVLAWTLDLEPAATKTVKTGYKIIWPEDMKLGSNGG